MKEKFATGLKLAGSDVSNALHFGIGTRMNFFCDDGRMPSWREQLERTVRKGRKTSTFQQCLLSNVND